MAIWLDLRLFIRPEITRSYQRRDLVRPLILRHRQISAIAQSSPRRWRLNNATFRPYRARDSNRRSPKDSYVRAFRLFLEILRSVVSEGFPHRRRAPVERQHILPGGGEALGESDLSTSKQSLSEERNRIWAEIDMICSTLSTYHP